MRVKGDILNISLVEMRWLSNYSRDSVHYSMVDRCVGQIFNGDGRREL